MDSEVLRLLPTGSHDGPHNMALDERMVEVAALGRASLRFYTWTSPTVSLGYFQASAVRASDSVLASLPWVRRPSGGATLVHHMELTYALALPLGANWQGSEPWLLRMHRVIAQSLTAFGIPVQLAVGGPQDPSTGPLCFRQHTEGDVLCGSNKVVGSSQRKHRRALLQHGSILLERSPHAPHLPGIVDLTRIRVENAELQDRILADLVNETGWFVQGTPWLSEDLERAEQLVLEKYGQEWWNHKR